MNIQPVSSHIASAPIASTQAVNQAQAPQIAAKSDAPSLETADGVSIGEEKPAKKGFISWLKDLVKTQVEGPEVPYLERTCNKLEEVLSKAQPGDIPDKMPSHADKPGAPSGFYTSDGTCLSGSLLDPGAHIPSKADVCDYKELNIRDTAAKYDAEVKPYLSPVQKGVIKEYSGQAFMAMNSYLLGMEKDNEAQTLDRTVRCAAGALDKFEVPSGSILHRTAGFSELRNYMGDEKAIAKYGKLAKAGKSEKLAEILDLRLTGTQTNRKTFISTTAASDFKMIEHSKITTKYYVGEGVKGIFIAPDKDLCEFSGEYEYLLAPDTKETIMGVEYNPETKGIQLNIFLGDLPE